jgi:FixJ family two-component response regulator
MSNVHRGNEIAIVDDDESIRDSARMLLRSVGYRVSAFSSAEQFLDSGLIPETGCLILDIGMPGMSGFELQSHLTDSGAGIPIIFLTAHDDARNRQRAMDGGAADFFPKPFVPNALLAAVQTALARDAANHYPA